MQKRTKADRTYTVYFHLKTTQFLLILTTGKCVTASLPQKDTSLLVRDIRQTEVGRNKFMYRWHVLPSIDQVGWDLPRFGIAEEFNDLPLLFQANDLRQEDFESHRSNVKLNVFVEFVKGKLLKILLFFYYLMRIKSL